jgi:hypothetical protein
MPELRSKTGLLNYGGGHVERARFYYGAEEAEPQDRSQIDPANHATWIEDDGTVGIRRGVAISVGATAAYSANYDALDWGN